MEELNPIPTGHGRNQPLYERHVTKSGRNRVNLVEIMLLSENFELHTSLQMGNLNFPNLGGTSLRSADPI